MLAVALIVFREVLEAALIVAIVASATRGLPRRGFWIGLGIAGGILGACAVGGLMGLISSAFEGSGQEIVNASILFSAAALISWHVVWMNSHGRKIASDMRSMGQSVCKGEKEISVLAAVVGLAVIREGAEIVLMLQGLWAGASPVAMVSGGVIGIVGGVLMGCLVYAGFLALSVRRIFTMTNVLLVLIAAGMAARGANFLVQADLLSPLGDRWWDTSFLLSDQSLVGQIFGTLIGYIAHPNGTQVLFYAGTVAIVVSLLRFSGNKVFAGSPSAR